MPGIFPFGGGPFGGLSPPPTPPSPPTPTVISTSGSIFQSAVAARIFHCDKLNGTWEEVQNCYCAHLRKTVAPAIDQATLLWEFGIKQQPDETAFTVVAPLDLTGQFIRLDIPTECTWTWSTAGGGSWTCTGSTSPTGDLSFCLAAPPAPGTINGETQTMPGAPLHWFGIAEGDSLRPNGRFYNPQVGSSGHQTVTVYGLLRMLERKQIESAIVANKDETATVAIGQGLTFNLDDRGHFTARGNRGRVFRDTEGTSDQGDWDANANSPTLTSGSGTTGEYYTVSVSGTTTIDGISAWDVGDRLYFNGTVWKKAEGMPVFSYRERNQKEWSAKQAVEHILEHHAPFLDGITWKLDVGSGSLDWNPRAVATDRRTPKQVLDELIARHRGVGYRLDFDGVSTLTIKVFSMSDVALTMPNGTTFDANPDQYSLDFEDALDITHCTVSNLKTTEYHKVVVEGDQRTCTMSLRLAIGYDELIQDWTMSEEAAYFLAASHEAWYAGLTHKDKVKANKTARQDDRFRHVFERFRISDDWSKQTADPDDVLSLTMALPVVDLANAHPTLFPSPIDVCLPRLHILDHLPLRERYDYSEDHITNNDWQETATVIDDPPFLQPFSFLRTNVGAFGTGAWELLDKIDGDAFEAPDKRKWSINTRAHHDRAAVSLNVQGGVQHYFAASLWKSKYYANQGNWDASLNFPALASGVGIAGFYYIVSVAGSSELDGISDWVVGEKLYFDGSRWKRPPAIGDHTEDPKKNHGLDYYDAWVTLTVELPERSRIERQISLPATGEQQRELRIHVPDCRLDYVVPNTVVGIKNSQLQISDGGFVRDDTDKLATLARAAEVWYGKQRQTLDLTFRQVREIVKLGWLITDISSSYKKIGINSVVTAITYDFLQQTTQFETSYAEMDFIG